MEFRKLQFTDIDSVKQKLYEMAPSRANDYTVIGLFLWRDYLNVYFSVQEEGVYIYQLVDGVCLFYYPLCEDREAGFRKIIDYARREKLTYGFYPFQEKDFPILDALSVKYRTQTSEGYSDYIYLVDDLADLRGKRYHSQKNHVNRFMSAYPDWSVDKVAQEDMGSVKELFAEYVQNHPSRDMTEAEEYRKMPELLDNLAAYNLVCYRMTVNGRTEGFELGETVGDMYYSHVQKANTDIRGIYPALVNYVAKDIRGDVKYMNREEDLGNEGLRTSKRRYHPCGYIEKHMVFCE